jgi:predicted TIM-barrel fold metal-dependent hydrolase
MGDAWVVEGQPMLHTGQNVAGAGPIKFAFASYTTDGKPSPGTGDAIQRLTEQDLDGIDAEILFPPVFATRFIEGIQDREVYLALVRAYNTFLAEDYCSVAPDRLIGNAFIPITGVDDAVAEMEFAKSVGLRTITFHRFPNGTGNAKPEDDRFWEKSLELGMALSPHINFGDGTWPVALRRDYSLYPAAAGFAQHAQHYLPGYTLTQLIVDGVFDRFPDLRIYFAEANCSLLPGMLYYLDRDYLAYRDWFDVHLKKMPSEYVLEHCMFGMIQEKPVLRMAAAGLMPIDVLMWGSDFPHGAGTFPDSENYIAELFADFDEETKRRILVEIPAKYFGLDVDADLTATPV